MQQLMYIGSYADRNQEGIHLAALDLATGSLRRLAGFSGVDSPSYLCLNARGTRLYAVSEQEKAGAVCAFSVDPRGNLSPLNRMPTEGGASCHVALAPEEDCLAVANYLSGSVQLFPLTPDGSLLPASCSITCQGHGPDSLRQTGPHAHFVQFLSGTPRRLLAVDLGCDALVTYTLEEYTHTLHLSDRLALPPGEGPRHLVRSPVRPELFYLNSELGNRIFTLKSGPGHWEILSQQSAGPEHISGTFYPAALRVSRDGRFLYTSSRGEPGKGGDSIVTYTLDPQTGCPGAPRFFPTAAGPRDIQRFGSWLVAACQGDGQLISYQLDPETGAPLKPCSCLSLSSPCCIAELP